MDRSLRQCNNARIPGLHHWQTCGFRKAHGFAFITNNYGIRERTLAHELSRGDTRRSRSSKKGHRAAAPRVCGNSLTRETKNHGGVPVPDRAPPFLYPPRTPLIAAPGMRHAEGFHRASSWRPAPQTQCRIAPLLAISARVPVPDAVPWQRSQARRARQLNMKEIHKASPEEEASSC